MNAEHGRGADGTGGTGFPTLDSFDGSGVDLDALADYLADALDTADREVVAARIATDPAWAAAYQALRDADAAVRDDLTALAADRPVMPDDVAARIDAALAMAAEPSEPPVPPDSRPAVVAPISLAARRRRRMRIAGVAAMAAAVLTVAGIGVGIVTSGTTSQRSTTANGASAPREEDNFAGEAPPETLSPSPRPGIQSGQNDTTRPEKADPVIRHTGRNYTAATLRQVLASPPPARRPSRDPLAPPFAGSVPRELQRLSEEKERQRCFDAVRRRHGAYPTVVDYARFDGEAALIMVLPPADGGSRPLIVVVGPECGKADADQRYVQR